MSPHRFNEDELVERPAMELLAELGWETVNAYTEVLGPGGTLGRDSQHDAFLAHRLRDALTVLNPEVPESIREEALAEITRDRSLMLPVRANQEIHELLREGYRAEWVDDRGEPQFAVVRYIDLHDSAKNDWLAVKQFWMKGTLHDRRPDAVLFVNGIPLVLLEFKGAPISVEDGYDDEHHATTGTRSRSCSGRTGSSSSRTARRPRSVPRTRPWEFFGDWKMIDAEGNRGVVALETALRGTCTQDYLLDIIENFVAYPERPGGLVKSVARNHQYLGVNARSRTCTRSAQRATSASACSGTPRGRASRCRCCGSPRRCCASLPGNWTFVMVTDRKELDAQLYEEFADAGAITRARRRPRRAAGASAGAAGQPTTATSSR